MRHSSGFGAEPARTWAPDGRRLVIVGSGRRATISYERFSSDSPYEVAAFSVEAEYLRADTHCGIPLVTLEHMASVYPPAEYLAFVAISPANLNRERRRLYETVKSMGYSCASYVSSQAFVAGNVEIGANTFVHAFAAVQYGVHVGDNAIIESGTCVGHSSLIENDCFIGEHVVISGFCRIGCGSFLGANSCIADDIVIAENCELSPGAIILKSTLSDHIYTGNPARPTRRSS